MAVLVYLNDPEKKPFPLFRHITRVGSDPGADVTLDDAHVAADHAQIFRDGNDYILTSLGQGRPLWVNGRKERRTKLSEGDEVQLGNARLRFTRETHVATGVTQSTDPVAAYREIVAFSTTLMRHNDVDALLATLMDAVVDLSHADKGFLILFEDGQPHVKVARHVAPEHLGDAIKELSDSILSKVIRDLQPIIVSNALHDQEFKASASVMSLRLCSVMCVPLLDGGQLLGIIYLGSNQVANLFEADTLAATTVFAAQAALLLRNALLLNELRSDNASLREAMQDKCFGDIVGSSETMQHIFHKIRKVAPTDVSVLVTGETGTGKELIATEIHRRSDRADKPFVVLNCGALPENLLESELFGHVRGAFTGAVATRPGRFQAAHGGTLFLDEIAEIAPALQVKLLRALQEKVVCKVGDSKPEQIDIRVIAATHRNLDEGMRKGTFREDLYYRLNVVHLHIPPLRERGDDLLLIARYLLKRFAEKYRSRVKGFTPQCVLLMKKYAWPGNIRQLENRIKKAVIMADGLYLTPDDLELSDADLSVVVPLNQAKEEFQRCYINSILARNGGNRTQTAHDLGVDPRTIFRHLEREESPC